MTPKTQRGGLDRSATPAWKKATYYLNGDLVIPRNPNARGGVYRAITGETGGDSGAVEPIWPTPGAPDVTDNTVTWHYERAETDTLIGPFAVPGTRQGFGRISLTEVLSAYPARVFVDHTTGVPANTTWSDDFKVHDGTQPVRIALVWTDEPAQITSGNAIAAGTPVLVNDFNMTLEIGPPNQCVERFAGNQLNSNETPISFACSGAIGADTQNNVEVIRFAKPTGTQFRVKVTRSQGLYDQSFALVIYNAYQINEPVPLSPPSALAATATSQNQVRVTWAPASGSGTITYEVQRSSGATFPFFVVGTTTSTTFDDIALAANTTYMYRVRARNGSSVIPVSNSDLATTTIFSDDPLVVGSTIARAAHIEQLRTAAAAIRAFAGVSTFTWTDAPLSGVIITAVHLSELRIAIADARSAIGLTVPPLTDATLTSGETSIKAAHVQELRDLVK